MFIEKNEFFDNANQIAQLGRHRLFISFLDLNALKHINDTLGHLIGDMVINTVTDIIDQFTGKTAIYTKFGGDEFVLAFQASTRKEASFTIQALLTSIKSNKDIRLKTGGITASAGTVEYSKEKYGSIKEAVDYADKLMYVAKKDPPGFCAFDDDQTLKNLTKINRREGSMSRPYFDWVVTHVYKQNPMLDYSELLRIAREVWVSADDVDNMSPKTLTSLILLHFDMKRINNA